MVNILIIWILTIIWVVAFVLFITLFFGYFLLVFILTKIKAKAVEKVKDFAPFVSILVPCYNMASVVDRKIENLLGTDYPRDKFEIVFVESGSTDNTYHKLLKYATQGKIKLVRQQRRLGKSSAINCGLEACKSDIIVMTDCDARLEEDAVRKLIENFGDEKVGAVVGNLTIVPGKSITSKMNHLFYKIFRQKVREWESSFDSASFWSGELCAFRKSLLGRLDEDIINDDRHILLKIRSKGYRCVCEPLANVYERDAENASDQIDHKRRTTTGTIQGTLRFRYMLGNPKYGLFGMLVLPAHLWRVILLPILLLITEVLSPLAAIFFLSSFTGAILLVVLILAFVLLNTSASGRKLVSSLCYGFLVQLGIIGGIIDYIRGRQDVLWEKIPKE